MLLQAVQQLQGLPSIGFSQLTALARIFAQVVLPVPLVPVIDELIFQRLRDRHLTDHIVEGLRTIFAVKCLIHSVHLLSLIV